MGDPNENTESSAVMAMGVWVFLFVLPCWAITAEEMARQLGFVRPSSSAPRPRSARPTSVESTVRKSVERDRSDAISGQDEKQRQRAAASLAQMAKMQAVWAEVDRNRAAGKTKISFQTFTLAPEVHKRMRTEHRKDFIRRVHQKMGKGKDVVERAVRAREASLSSVVKDGDTELN